jgi:AcrR family transcriptional regulator
MPTLGATKKLGAETSATRAALLEAAEALIREEGWAAVTARRVAQRAGLKFQLIYYYFNSLDDLFLEVFQRGVEQNFVRLQEVAASEDLPRALWGFSNDSRDNRFTLEFMAMANHKPVIRQAIAEYAERMRVLQTAALQRYLGARGVEPRLPPIVTAFVMTGISRALSLEAGLGIAGGHIETQALVEAWLQDLERRA